MQFKKLVASAALTSTTLAEYKVGEPWSTLTPSGTFKGARSSYSATFGIAVQAIPSSATHTASHAKRDIPVSAQQISQIDDGQIQATTATTVLKPKSSAQPISQIRDGQIQATTKTVCPSSSTKPKPSAQPISQIGDGQIQATTKTVSPTTSPKPKPSAQPISQIGDGQIQATTKTVSPTTSPKPKPSAQPISQIGDGQIQATTRTTSSSSAKPKPSAQPISQIGDGQIQATTRTTSSSSAKPKPSAQPISQIGDGQIQATTVTTSVKTKSGSQPTKPSVQLHSQVGDEKTQVPTRTSTVPGAGIHETHTIGNVNRITTTLAPTSSHTPSSASDDVALAQSCKTHGTLQLRLADGVLHDAKGRIGSIVANHQFQFDGPPPQAGAIYAGGWSVTPQGNLAIGEADVFYQCLSGNFYNLYDENIGSECFPVHLEVVELVDC